MTLAALERERREPAAPSADVDPSLRTDSAKALVCARCGATITDAREAIVVSGRHAHDLVNPSGVAFHVRCFRDAPGCGCVGDASSFFSWFSGYAWRIAICATCHAHLGWRFEGDDAFFGLIADRLSERSA